MSRLRPNERMNDNHRISTMFRLLIAATVTTALALPTAVLADENDEERYILAQLEDTPSDDGTPTPETLAAPAELPMPNGSDDSTAISLSEDEEELLELEQAIPMCSTGEVYDGGLWYVQTDFVYLFNQKLRQDFNIATDEADPENRSDLRTDHLKLRWRPGTRLTIGRELGSDNLSRDQVIEFSYFGLFDWVQGTSLTGFNGGATVSNSFMPFFDPANNVSAEYAADLNSFEVNFRLRPRLEQDRLLMSHDGTWSRQCTPGLRSSYLAGLRYIKLDEDFDIFTTRTDATSYNATQSVEVRNDLFGIQGGVELIHQDCRWHWGFRSKIGALINSADRSRRDFVRFQDDSTLEFKQRGEDDQLAIMYEMGMFAAYQLHPKVAARIAYDALWLHGVGRAADGMEEFGFGLSKDMDANENGFYHGLTLGLEMKW